MLLTQFAELLAGTVQLGDDRLGGAGFLFPTAFEPVGAILPEHPGNVLFGRLSPDGGRLAFVVSEPRDTGSVSHVWLADVRSGEVHQATFSAKSERAPQWSPDGRTLAFLSSRGGEMQLYVQPVDGLGRFVQLVGHLTVHVGVLPATGDARTLGHVDLSPAELRDAYRSGITGTHYTIEIPLEDPGAAGSVCDARVHYVDGRTGRRFEAHRSIRRR